MGYNVLAVYSVAAEEAEVRMAAPLACNALLGATEAGRACPACRNQIVGSLYYSPLPFV